MQKRTSTALEQPMTPYAGDFARSAQEQAVAIAAGRWADVDAANIAEEIDALGISQRTDIRSRLRVLMAHLLKTQHQSERATASWHDTIVEQAVSIDELLLASPSLRRELPVLSPTPIRVHVGWQRKKPGCPSQLSQRPRRRNLKPRWLLHSLKTNSMAISGPLINHHRKSVLRYCTRRERIDGDLRHYLGEASLAAPLKPGEMP